MKRVGHEGRPKDLAWRDRPSVCDLSGHLAALEMACCGGAALHLKTQSLDSSPMGAYLSLDELVRLARACSIVSFKKDDPLPESPFYLVLKGEVRVLTPEGEVLVDKREGAFFTRRAGLVATPTPTLKKRVATAIILPSQLSDIEKKLRTGVENAVDVVERGATKAATIIKRGSTMAVAKTSMFPVAHAQHRASISRAVALPKDLIEGTAAAGDGEPTTTIVAKTNGRCIFVTPEKLDPLLIRRAAGGVRRRSMSLSAQHLG